MIDAICTIGKKVDMDHARRLADRFETRIINEIPEDKSARYFLMDKSGISYVSGNNELKGDFTRMLSRVGSGHLQHEIILKAAKTSAKQKEADENVCGMRAVDATAGLGEDSFILAAGGFNVELIEHNPITQVLLQDALIRGKRDPMLRDIVGRMTLVKGDSKEILSKLSYSPDLIYLDPMFPEKKGSAQTKKKLQVLHTIELPCSDEDELMKAAMNAGPKKILVKRPPDGKYLAGINPTYSVTRKAVRYDCIVLT